MQKNWLIRTHRKQILGPVPKDKVLELVKKGSLKDDDEICSGNGYWFSISEKDLMQRYLFGGEEQRFNPISESPDVLTANGDKEKEDLEIESQVDHTAHSLTLPDEIIEGRKAKEERRANNPSARASSPTDDLKNEESEKSSPDITSSETDSKE